MSSLERTITPPRRWWKVFGKRGGRSYFVLTALLPLLSYMLLWEVLPIIWTLCLSFFDYSPSRSGGVILGFGGTNPYIGLEHFRRMMGNSLQAQLFRTSLINTLMFAFIAVPLNLLITIPLAVAIESVHERFKGFFRFIYFLPTVTTSVAVAAMWKYLYHPQQGLFNIILKGVGLQPVIWLGDPRATLGGVPVALWAVILASVWHDMGYNLIILIAALQAIPETFKEAARIDGASEWRVFWHITLPLLRPAIVSASTLTMMYFFHAFDIIQIMTDGGPSNQTQVLVLDIYQNAFRSGRMGWAGAEAFILFLIVLLVTLLQLRLARKEWHYDT
ncbi:MAG: sugar ABC transporter permease [Ardenticatenales bacterium]|nr:sugar ABC transporter permease [Ardenticatenales bacterium]